MATEISSVQKLRDLLIAETQRRLFTESIPRIKKCLGLLSEDEIWHRPNEHSNSVGNLVLHLCGNVRQWLISAMGGKADIRTRHQEFDEKGPLPTRDLVFKLDQLEHDAREVLNRVSPDMLLKTYHVQGYEESGLSILVHIVEHFSGHVGQITYYVKAHKNLSTGYYDDQNLDAKNE